MLAFTLRADSFVESQSGKVIIDDEADMAQLATHVALRAYNCNDDGGGQYSVVDSIDIGPINSYKRWSSWKSYVEYAEATPDTADYLSFKELKNATPGKIACSGTASTLPFVDKSALQMLANFATDSHWGNDQEGRYGRMEFEVNETIYVGGIESSGHAYGCYGFDQTGHPDGITDMVIVVADEDDYNYFNWDTNIHRTCHSVADPSQTISVDTNGNSQDGAFLTLTVIGDEAERNDINTVNLQGTAWDFFNNAVDTEIDYGTSKLCPGTMGYIQANTGGQDAAIGDQGTENDPMYGPQDVPGKHGEQVGGNAGTANQVRLFMVIENAGNC